MLFCYVAELGVQCSRGPTLQVDVILLGAAVTVAAQSEMLGLGRRLGANALVTEAPHFVGHRIEFGSCVVASSSHRALPWLSYRLLAIVPITGWAYGDSLGDDKWYMNSNMHADF